MVECDIADTLINIAPLASVEFSTRYKWSRPDDEIEILTAQHDRKYSFHTDIEDCPWIVLDLHRIFRVKYIKITNIITPAFQERAKTLKVEASLDKSFSHAFLLLDMNRNWGKEIDVHLENIEIRYLKLSLKERNPFHLRKIEVFCDYYNILPNLSIENLYKIKLYEKIIEILGPNFTYTAKIYKNNVVVLSANNNKDKYIDYKIVIHKETIYASLIIEKKYFKNSELETYIYNIIKNKNTSIFIDIDHKLHIKTVISKRFFIKKFKMIHNQIYDKINLFICMLSHKIEINKAKKIIIIDSDSGVKYWGFADRLRGILSAIKICNDINVDYYIKFEEPFNLNKYYEFKNYNAVDMNYINKASHCCFQLTTLDSFDGFDCKTLIEKSMNCYDIVTIKTNNAFFHDEYNTIYKENFKKTEFLSEELSKYKNIISDDYVTISCRLINALGDFNEQNQNFHPIEKHKQQKLLEKLKSELINFIKTKKINKNIVVLSDSIRFLDFIKNIPNVFVFPDNISHIAMLDVESDESQKCFLKTLIDFNIILDAQQIYRFESECLYRTGFPWLAAMCSGKKLLIHNF